MMTLISMFGGYIIVLITVGLWSENEKRDTSLAQKLIKLTDKEIHAIERMSLFVSNKYWFVRCLCMKRWWKNKKRFGMSWEGKEKEYLSRYAASK